MWRLLGAKRPIVIGLLALGNVPGILLGLPAVACIKLQVFYLDSQNLDLNPCGNIVVIMMQNLKVQFFEKSMIHLNCFGSVLQKIPLNCICFVFLCLRRMSSIGASNDSYPE
jgi:hypothetical protein